MTTIVNNQAVSLQVGTTELGPLNLPQGTKFLLVTYSNSAWPVTSDGTITVTLKVSDDGGNNYRDQWTDTFQHVRLTRRGVTQTQAQFGIQLEQPFGSTSKLRVVFVSSVAISTTVSVDAT